MIFGRFCPKCNQYKLNHQKICNMLLDLEVVGAPRFLLALAKLDFDHKIALFS